MQKTFWLRSLLTASLAVLLTAASSFADEVQVDLTWFQDDPNPAGGTSAGTISTTIGGIPFSAPLPTPSLFTQKDTLLGGETMPLVGPGGEGVVGFSNGGGNDGGFYIGWGGITVDLLAEVNGNAFKFPVPLVIEDGDRRSFSWQMFDDPIGATDVVGENRFAAYFGDDGAGHRHSGDNEDYIAGQDSFRESESGGLGDDSHGDEFGVNISLRTSTGGSIFVADVNIGAEFFRDDSGAVLVSDGTTPLFSPGDVNIDFAVDLLDFEIIRANFLQSGGRLDGDLDNSGFVDFDDFDQWKANASPLAASSASIPEPSTAVLLMLLTAVCTLRRPCEFSFPV